jgi:P pilus assembly chaperone PapD
MQATFRRARAGLARSFALALPALATAERAAAQISVDDLELFLVADRAATGVIRVTNESERPAQVLVDVQDWRRDAGGVNEFLPLASHPRSCGPKLQVFPLGLRLNPGETQPLRVTFDGEAERSCWNVVFLQANEPPAAGGRAGSQITYVVRTGVKVYVEPAGVAPEGEIQGVRALSDSAGARRVEVSFRNGGEAHLKPRGVLEVRRADDSVAGRVPLEEFAIEPEGIRRLAVPLPALAPGQYVLLALLDYGGRDIAAGQLELVVR